MTNAEKATTYAVLHPEPVQRSVPEFYQKWSTPYGPEFWRSSTCERTTMSPYKCAIVKAPRHGWVQTSYIHYIPEFDMLEFSVVAINNAGRHMHNDVYRWDYASERVFLVKGDPRPYASSGEELWPEANKPYCNTAFIAYLKKLLHSFFNDAGNPQYREIERFCGIKMNLEGFVDEYCKYMVPRTEEESIPKPVKDLRQIIREFLQNHMKSFSLGRFTTAYYERINEVCSVIRFLCSEITSKEPCLTDIFEYQRIYITPGGLFDWKQHLGAWYQERIEVNTENVFNTDVFLQCKEVAYVYDIALNIHNGSENLETIVNLMRHPFIERLYKAGYQNIAKYLLFHDYSKAFKGLFGKAEQKSGSMLRITGCNKCMLSVMDRERSEMAYYGTAIKIFRKVFGRDYQCFSERKIEKYMGAFAAMSKVAETKSQTWTRVVLGHEEFRNTDKALIEHFVNLYHTDHNIFEVIADTRNLYLRLRMNWDAAVDSMCTREDIYRMHNRAVEQFNQMRGATVGNIVSSKKETWQASFDSLQEGRRKWYNFENEAFLIRVPERLDEIMIEGKRLRHCVGSYTFQHAQGITDILFLRKVTHPDDPFYTIEVKNNRVVQIHGFANKWLGCNPEAVSFVYEWTRRIGVQCDERILLCRSTRYMNDGSMLDESYLFQDADTLKIWKSAG